MKIAVIGSGGVGSFYGGRLAHAGYHVSFIARGSHLEALRDNGLTIENETPGRHSVGRAHGVSLPEDYAAQRLAFADTVPADMNSSLPHALEHENPLEVEWLSGDVVQLGRAVGVPTPANRAVWDILALHAAGKRKNT